MVQDFSTKIEQFWDWFYDNDTKIKAIITGNSHQDKQLLTETLNNYILGFGLFGWEIGPSNTKPFFFTLSPNGDWELLDLSISIIEAAPLLPDWQLNYCKPANNTETSISIFDDAMNQHHVDTSLWNYSLLRCDDSQFEITFEAHNAAHIDHDTQLNIAEKLLVNLLGEEKKIRWFRQISICTTFDTDEKPFAMPINLLGEHLQK